MYKIRKFVNHIVKKLFQVYFDEINVSHFKYILSHDKIPHINIHKKYELHMAVFKSTVTQYKNGGHFIYGDDKIIIIYPRFRYNINIHGICMNNIFNNDSTIITMDGKVLSFEY
jgi:phage terminase large subunit-like protein